MKMTRRAAVWGAGLLTLALAALSAEAQLYFHDDFSDANESEQKWAPLSGAWKLEDGEYRQTGGGR